jgi:hypothetical protein
LHVEGDVAVDVAPVSLNADATITGTLFYGDSPPSIAGGASLDARGGSVRSSGMCTDEQSPTLDISSLIAARVDDNDNSTVQPELDKLTHVSGPVTVRLPCGRYYVRQIEGAGMLTIHALGNITLYVGNEVNIGGGLHVSTAQGSRVTLVVAADVRVKGGFRMGEAGNPRMQLVVGGEHVYFERGDTFVGGALYAPQADLLSDAPLEIEGAVPRARVSERGVAEYGAAHPV